VALGVGGTLAYQKDETMSDVNVQTVGIVDIAQLEYERVVDATKGAADNEPNNANWVALPEYATEFNGVTYIPDALQRFTQNKTMAPAYYSNTDGVVMWDDRTNHTASDDPESHQQSWKEIGAPGSNQLFDDSISNVLDKFVFVENIGGKDAYVRTVFAFEKGIFTAEDYNDKMVHLNRNTEATGTNWKWTPFSESMKATIGGTEYYLTVATYNRGDGIVKPGEITRPSLLQVFFDPAVENEHIKALGDTYNILAISQAVQADLSPNLNAEESLNKAFGEITATNHPWTNTARVSNREDINKALGKSDALIFENDISLNADMSSSYGKAGLVQNGETIFGQNNTLSVSGANSTWDCAIATRGGKISNLNVKGAFRAVFAYKTDDDVIIEDCTLEAVYPIHSDSATKSFIVSNCKLLGWTSYASSMKGATFTDCYFGKGCGYAFMRPYAPTTLKNCEFEIGFKIDASRTSITFVDCYYDGQLITEDNVGTLLSSGTVTIQNTKK
jgi:hypothetical protein